MTVAEQLRNDLLMYPLIFKNKFDVYHQWFCVNGNGLEWVDGELVDPVNDKCSTIEEAIEKQFDTYVFNSEFFDSNVLNKHTDYDLFNAPLYQIKAMKENIFLILDIENRIEDFSNEREIYPLSEYSMILNFPENIKPDWLEAVKEMYRYLINNYDKLSSNDKTYVNKLKILMRKEKLNNLKK